MAVFLYGEQRRPGVIHAARGSSARDRPGVDKLWQIPGHRASPENTCMADHELEIVGLGARVHLFVQPDARQRFRWLFEEVLGCSVAERDFGLEHPIMLVRFANGSAFSVEFTELAPADVRPPELD